MITLSNINIKFGDRVLFNSISFLVKDNERIGLVGRNGAGKSTLLKIIAGEYSPDSGKIEIPPQKTIGYLKQDIVFEDDRTVYDEVFTAFEDIVDIERKIDELNDELSKRDDYQSNEYSRILDDLAILHDKEHYIGAVNVDAEIQKILIGLGFKEKDQQRKLSEFSGGWKMRINLAKLMLSRPDYLLLDEPTNHLDIESIIWFEKYIIEYSGTVILISHDRMFMNNTVNRVVELEMGKVYDYPGTFDQYIIKRDERRELQQSGFDRQQRIIKEKEKTIDRFRAKATKAKMARSMQKQLDKIDRIELDQVDTAKMKIRFPDASRSSLIVAKAENLSKSYGRNEVFRDINLQIERKQRVAFVGQNGQGKTTLARILIRDLDATSGDNILGGNVEIGYYAQDQADRLDGNITLLKHMEDHAPHHLSSKIRSILGAFLFSGEDVEKKIMVLSGGERARLALATLMLQEFNFLVLDEPTNHLDLLSKDVLKNAVNAYNGTILIVSHDRDFLDGLCDLIYEFKEGEVKKFLGGINEFLANRQAEDMRKIELKTVQDIPKVRKDEKVKEVVSDERVYSREEKKAIRNTEKSIEKLEKRLEKIELEMSDPDFYSREDSNSILEKYKAGKKELDTLFEKWEKLME